MQHAGVSVHQMEAETPQLQDFPMNLVLEICVKLCLEKNYWRQNPLPTPTVTDLNQEPA